MVSPPKAPISEYASTSLITIDINAPLKQVAKILTKSNIHGAPVKGDGQLVGMVTLTDLGKAIATGNYGSAGDIMNRNVFTVEEDMPVYEAMRLFTEYNVGRLIVTAKGSPKGIITQSDVLRRILTL
jgi:predicted transcriptional regulator